MTLSGLSPITPRVAEDALLGRTIAGKYRVLSRVGAGGMGAVYKAQQIALEKPVAVKVLHSALEVDAHFVARFHVEAKAASMFDHPSSTRVIDFGEEPDGLLYIVMEFLEGQTLLDVIDRESPLAPPRVADILRQALAALAVAHERGILHRDLKPENIVLLNGRDDEGDTHDVVKVCDFGIAKLADVPAPGSFGGATTLRDGLDGKTFATDPGGRKSGSHEHAEPTITEPSAPVRAIHATPGGVVITPAPPEVGPPITRVGLIIGTPEYMSPEQARGEPVDARSDLYSMGCVLYHMITGRPPFHGDSPLVTATLHATMEPKRPSEINPDVDPTLERVCMHAMQKNLQDRYATARDMRSDLRSLVPQSNATEPLFMPSADSSAKLQPIGDDFKAPPQVPGVPQRRSGFLLGGVLLALGAASGIWMFVRTPKPADPTTTTEITSVTADAGMGVDLSNVIDAALVTHTATPTGTATSASTATGPRPPATGSAGNAHGPPANGTSAGNVSVVHVDAEHVPLSSVTGAVSRGILLNCYRNALKAGGGHGDGTTTIDVQMDNGKITKAVLEDDFGLATLKGCVSYNLHNRAVAATEPGAHATVEVLFSDD